MTTIERPVLARRCICSHLWSDHTVSCDSLDCPCRFTFAIPEAPSLDAAWAEAEAALPKGHNDLWLERHDSGYFASFDYDGSGPIGHGATPAEALLALAAKLTEEQG